MLMRKLNYENEISTIETFISQQLKIAGFKNIIIGLSGGIDSAVTAALAVKTIGRENVFGVMMPYSTSSFSSLEDAEYLANKLGITYRIIEITPMVDKYFQLYEPEAGIMRKANIMARERMCVLYDLSAKLSALVAGTNNQNYEIIYL